MGLLKMIFWGALFLVLTFAFTVLFEHGISNYSQNWNLEMDKLMKMVHSTAEKPKI